MARQWLAIACVMALTTVAQAGPFDKHNTDLFNQTMSRCEGNLKIRRWDFATRCAADADKAAQKVTDPGMRQPLLDKLVDFKKRLEELSSADSSAKTKSAADKAAAGGVADQALLDGLAKLPPDSVKPVSFHEKTPTDALVTPWIEQMRKWMVADQEIVATLKPFEATYKPHWNDPFPAAGDNQTRYRIYHRYVDQIPQDLKGAMVRPLSEWSSMASAQFATQEIPDKPANWQAYGQQLAHLQDCIDAARWLHQLSELQGKDAAASDATGKQCADRMPAWKAASDAWIQKQRMPRSAGNAKMLATAKVTIAAYRSGPDAATPLEAIVVSTAMEHQKLYERDGDQVTKLDWDEFQATTAEKVGDQYMLRVYTLIYARSDWPQNPVGKWYVKTTLDWAPILKENIHK